MTDPVADMLTRIRNAVAKSMTSLEMPSSSLKLGICEVLKREGYIQDFEIVQKPVQNDIRITLKYGPEGEKVIQGIRRASKPGRRIYRNVQTLPRILRGLGIAIVSTSRGVLSDRECRAQNVGGEILCTVW
jgi:small subunit ribosomal protein S8